MEKRRFDFISDIKTASLTGVVVLHCMLFYSNEQMTDYEIHSSKGAFPVSENPERPHPDPSIMSEMSDTTASETSDIEDKPVDDSSNSEKRDSIQ